MASVWESIVAETETKSKENGNEIKFNKPKNDDSHVKTKTGAPYSNWGFCKTGSEVWIELELKPKNKIPQDDIYNRIKSSKSDITKALGQALTFKLGGNDRRIRLILRNDGHVNATDKEQFSDKMITFIETLSPYLSRT